MSTIPSKPKEAIHLLFMRTLVYLGAVLLFVMPLASTAGVLAAAAAVPLGIFLSCRLAPSRLRLPVLGIGWAAFMLLGFLLIQWLGSTVWVAQMFGINGTLGLLQVLTWGLGTLGVVFALRLLAMRYPVLTLLEVAAVAGAVVFLFAGHRDLQIDQPRSFSDWAFSRGYDPLAILLIIGIVTLVGLALLLFQRQHPARTVSALMMLFVPGMLLFWLMPGCLDEHNRKKRDDAADKKKDKNKDRNKDRKDGRDGRDGKDGKDKRKPVPMPVPEWVALVTFLDDYQPLEHGYYFREDSQSRLDGVRLVRAKQPGVDEDSPNGFPTKPTTINAAELSAAWADYGPVTFLQLVPTKVALIMDLPKPFGLVKPLTLEPRKNPNPKKFKKAYSGTSAVLINPKVNVYYFSRLTPTKLRVAGIPEAAIAKLQPYLAERGYYRENWFKNSLRRALAEDEYNRYHAAIMDLAREQHTLSLYTMLKDCPAGDSAWPESVRQLYLAYPQDARYRKLSEQIVKAAIEPAQQKSALLRALAIKRWFWENTKYTRRQNHAQADDPTASYLFGNRLGKCTDIAQAMVYLLRSQGIPARVAGGYHVPAERRKRNRSLLIQTTDAHAWCEIYFQGPGWITMDAGAPSIDPPIPPPPEPIVVYYDKLANPDEIVDEEEPSRWGALVSLFLRSLLVLAAVLLVSLYIIKYWRRLAPRLAGERSLYRLCYRATLDRLAEVGVFRQFGETREEFAVRLARLSPEFVTLSQAHVRQAVAGVPSFNRATWMDLKNRIDEAIGRTFSFWRRLWGLANPVTWLWVR
jgi:hypothetical protein